MLETWQVYTGDVSDKALEFSLNLILISLSGRAATMGPPVTGPRAPEGGPPRGGSMPRPGGPPAPRGGGPAGGPNVRPGMFV